MDKKFRVNTNGVNNMATAFQRGESQSSSQQQQQQQPQMQYPSSSQYHQDLDLQTLESSFGRLSFTDPSVYQNQYTQVFNGGGGGYSHHHRELELQRFNQRVLFQNDCVNGSYGNNGFLNGVSYPSRNLVSDQNPWDYRNGGISNSSWRSDEGFGYNQDPSSSSSMKNGGRGSRLLMFARDRVDSKQLENKISNGSKEQIDIVFNNLIDHICDLMVDPFGNEVVKKLMLKCDSEQITKIVDVVTLNQFQFVNICFDSLGDIRSDAIQVLLKQMKDRFQDQIPRIVGVISMVAVQLTRSNHAKHVILTCFTVFNLQQYRDLLEVVARNCYQIAIDQHGCCMLQQCLTKDSYEIKHRLFREIISHALKLCLNCYGNYVVQYVVELYVLPVTEQLIMQLVGSYGYLARNKYGSHVVQKLLKTSGIDSRLIVHDMLQEIDSLLLDPFGNYVVQTAWFVSKDQERHMLRFHIERNIRLMRCNKFGNKILEKLNL